MAMVGVVVPGSVSGDETTETVVFGAGVVVTGMVAGVESTGGSRSVWSRRDTTTSAPIKLATTAPPTTAALSAC